MATARKKKISKETQRVAVRTALLGFAASFGVVDVAAQRRLAARFWRILPRDLSAEASVGRLTRLITVWGEAVIGRKLRLAELRSAFMASGVDPMVLLLPRDQLGDVIAPLLSAVPQSHPDEKPLPMPVQPLQPMSLWSFLTGAAFSDSTSSVRVV